MKIRIALTCLLLALFLISATSCSIHSSSSKSGKIPPGQAKKATGSKSAKPYAPGQQKKS